MELINDFTIDVGKQQSFKYLWAKQYDHNARKYRLIITNQNVPLALTGKEYITLSLEDSGGENYSNTPCPFGDDGYPYIVFTDSMLSREGDIKCEIRVYDSQGGSVATTFTFNMEVSRSLLNQSRMVESSEFNVLNDLILQASAIKGMVDDFSDNKAQMEALIQQINTDITNYQNNYTNLSQEAQGLINDVQVFLTTVESSEQDRITAEQNRVAAEAQRQQDFEDKVQDVETRVSDAISDTAEAIERANTTIENANSAIDDTKAATAAANASSASANAAHDACMAAIEQLKYELVDIDGGDPAEAIAYDDDCNGGEP